jgi:GntR family transcriptional repressor for pyruvate dehydrogenase complex
VNTSVKNYDQSLSDQAAETLEARILDGHLKPGDRLPSERALEIDLQVSRTALREALKKLEAGGLVRAQVGRGRFVTEQPTRLRSRSMVKEWLRSQRGQIEDLNEIRRILECAALRNAPDSELAEIVPRLHAILDEADAAVRASDADQGADLDAQFHALLCSATQNHPLSALIGELIDLARLTGRAVYSVSHAARHSLGDHREIVRLIEAGDRGAAALLLDLHHQRAVRIAAGDATPAKVHP